MEELELDDEAAKRASRAMGLAMLYAAWGIMVWMIFVYGATPRPRAPAPRAVPCGRVPCPLTPLCCGRQADIQPVRRKDGGSVRQVLGRRPRHRAGHQLPGPGHVEPADAGHHPAAGPADHRARTLVRAGARLAVRGRVLSASRRAACSSGRLLDAGPLCHRFQHVDFLSVQATLFGMSRTSFTERIGVYINFYSNNRY